MKKVVRLTENDIEKLVQKIIKEEDEKKQNQPTMTKHPAYSVIDDLGTKLSDLKDEFKDGIANAVSGSDGYHSEIDKFSSEFTNFIGKLEKLKTKINDYQEVENKKYEAEKRKKAEAEKRMKVQKRYQDHMNGSHYSY
jgi:hypothetical protein